jgi:hypothetical protein
MPEKIESLQRELAYGRDRRTILKGAAVSLLAAAGFGAASRNAGAVTCPAGGQTCSRRNPCPSSPCCVATCARGNAGQGQGGNVCVYSERVCSRGRTCVVANNGRESCRNV